MEELKPSKISGMIESLRAEAEFQADRFGRRVLADELTEAADMLEALNCRAAPENKALMVTLPCNIGDMVYEIEDGLPIIAYCVTGFVLGKTEFEDEDDIEERQGWQVEYGKPGIDCECPISEFGKSLFLTHKEAEQALASRRPEAPK